MVERSHYDIRQALFKAAGGVKSKWSSYTEVLGRPVTQFADGWAVPFYAATAYTPRLPGHHRLPTQSASREVLSTVDLVARRRFGRRPPSDSTPPSRSTLTSRKVAGVCAQLSRQSSLNRKMKPRYLGPLIVIGRNYGGAYVLCELDGTVLHRPVATFRLVPYFARMTPIYLPENFLDISDPRLQEMLHSDPDADAAEIEGDAPALNEPDDNNDDNDDHDDQDEGQRHTNE
ncbi:hypothetical protein HGRIS_003297 [Hohenbuehelia grisea]|uniref:Uncharacterized protein n=1 Tax=Hohenbuehelia grisea TaxID=104357 RepID=A0ABR3JGL8_9AGAR